MVNANEVIAEVGREYADFGRYRIRFRDREREIERLFNEGLNIPGLRILYGPYGAGKTTLLSRIYKILKSMGDEVFIAYMNFEGKTLSKVLSEALPNGDEALARIRSELGNIDTIKTGFAIAEAVKAAVEYALKSRNVGRASLILIIFDNFDKYLKEEVGDEHYTALSGLLEFFAESHEHPSEGVWAQYSDKQANTLFALSDQAAVKITTRLGSKGLTTPLLLWNLPRREFEGVINEVAELTGAKNFDTELLWNLLGGNVRELGDLVIRYGWDVRRWLQDRVIDHVIQVLTGAAKQEGKLPTDVLERLIELARGNAKDLGLSDTAHPDAVMGYFGLLESDVIIYVRLPGTVYLSELPEEPWVGKWYAYQIPAYYWVVKAIIEKGSINVGVGDVLKNN
jgi:ABC-type cobalamin/Fe3+-siderophores transport system ATPase subunit